MGRREPRIDDATLFEVITDRGEGAVGGAMAKAVAAWRRANLSNELHYRELTALLGALADDERTIRVRAPPPPGSVLGDGDADRQGHHPRRRW